MVLVKDMIEWLKCHYKSTDHIAVVIWTVDDVKCRAKEREQEITEEQMINIIERMNDKQDATLGISWDTIDCYLDDLE